VILVDSSVWIDAMRDGAGAEASHLRDLLDADEVALAAPVRVELLSGASKRDRPHLRRNLSALPNLRPDDGTWTRIDGWIDRAGDAGEHFGFADLLVASIAADGSHEVWSNDDDFRRMAKLKLVKLHEPAAWKRPKA